MAIKIGNLDINSFKVGSDDCKIYLGDTLLYPTTPSFKFTAKYSDGQTYSAECDSSSLITASVTKPTGYEYTAMTEAVIGDCVSTVAMNSFSGFTSLSSVTISDNVTTLANQVFKDCISLSEVKLPSGINKILSKTFENCTSLKNIDIPSGVTMIGGFENCTSLENITLPNALSEIYGEAFRGCTSLKNISIPSGVTRINSISFLNCTGLTGITVNALTPPSVSNDAFDNTNNCPIYVPCESVNAYKSASGWSTYASRIQCVEPTFEGKWKATYSDSHVESAQCGSSSEIAQNEINLSNLVSVEIGQCVETIGSNAFRECSSLTSIDIPNSVTSISDIAFLYCSSLTSIDIPDSVTSIGSVAFGYCSGLTSIDIPDSVTSIGSGAFNRCSRLTSITCNAIVPPNVSGTTLFDNTNNCPIYVPSGSVNAYKSASVWSRYSSRLQPIPNS